MSDYFLGEIRLFAFGYAPDQWHFCNGDLLQLTQNQALYALLGTQFGGDGVTTFGLPDLRGRTPVHHNPVSDPARITTGNVGTKAGADTVTLIPSQVPDHYHSASGTSDVATKARAAATGQQNMPATAVKNPSGSSDLPIYVAPGAPSTLQPLAPGLISPISAAVPHENRQPFLAANYCISLSGLWPTRP